MSVVIKFPVSTILLNTKCVVSTCEELEMQPSTMETLDTILLTQLAALVHLQEYTHATHLWRRYSSISSGDNSNRVTLPQFTRLWKALEPLLRAHAQDMTTAAATTTTSEDQSNNEKDTAIDAEGHTSVDTIPMANIYKSLQICLEEVRGDEAFELLLNFIKELQVSIRAMVAVAMESVYESIREEKCRTFLGFYHSAADTKMNMEDYLKDRKWTKEIETGLWIPYFDPSQGGDEKKSAVDRIQYLTRVIGFMETQRLNA
jgi:hypothetical protein